jgi:hypothetical protein
MIVCVSSRVYYAKHQTLQAPITQGSGATINGAIRPLDQAARNLSIVAVMGVAAAIYWRGRDPRRKQEN